MNVWLHDERSGAELEIDGDAQPGDLACMLAIGAQGEHVRIFVDGICITSLQAMPLNVMMLWRDGTVSSMSSSSALATSLVLLR